MTRILITNLKSADDKYINEVIKAYPDVEFKISRPGDNCLDPALYDGIDGVCNSSTFTFDRSYFEMLKEKGIHYFSIRSAGYNNVDVLAARENDVTVANGRGYSPETVAELGIALAMHLNRHLGLYYDNFRNYDFDRGPLINEMCQQTAAVIGLGSIGFKLALMLKPLVKEVLGAANHIDAEKAKLVTYASIEQIQEQADFIFLNLPYDPKTNYHLIDEAFLQKVKPTATIINLARGELVDLKAINKAIKENKLAGYGADVIENESQFYKKSFKDIDDPVLKETLSLYPRIILTPHIGAHSDYAAYRQLKLAVDNCLELINNGQCKNIVN